jgi:FkbM family methyltransferase
MHELCVHGLTVPLDRSEISPVIWAALSDGTYEQKESYIAPRIARPNDRILELGCGLGIVSTLVSRVPGVSIKAFDANPANIPLAKRVARANSADNIVFAHGLLSAGNPRTLPFYIREDMWMSSLVKEQGPYEKIIDVYTQDIDGYLYDNPTDLIIMDIEGAELALLTGSSLPGVERIFFEIHDHLYLLSDLGRISAALVTQGFSYDPRGSSGALVLYTRDNTPRSYRPDFLTDTP